MGSLLPYIVVNLILIFDLSAGTSRDSSSSAVAIENYGGSTSAYDVSSSSSDDSCSSKSEEKTCGPNEELDNCMQPICRPLDCSQRGQPVVCEPKSESSDDSEEGSCESRCICQAGYLKTANGDCVPEDRCYGELVCDENEVVDTCPSRCNDDFCPTSEDAAVCSISDPTSDSCGAPVCRCQFNRKRSNDNGTCIPTRDCPPFECSRPNEEYNSCPPICPSDNCSQASLSGRCPFPGRIGTVLQCNPKCRCIQGYWKDDGVCVPFAECPGICKENEEFSNCTQTALCGRENCSQRGETIPCPLIPEGSCQKGCVCKKGFLKAENGSCIPEEQCPEKLVCGENEVVETCPSRCNDDFCPTSEDAAVCSISDQTSDSCGAPVCRCQFNHKRSNDNGTCIPTRDCPPFDCSARPNEEYNSCPPFCPGEDCSQASPTGRCRIFGRIGIVLTCNPKCRCIQGHGRYNGICVPFDECPGVCKENEEFSNCTQAALCGGENCTQIGQPIACPLIAEGSCEKGCVCMKGFLRAENGSCIPEDQCPAKTCSNNEEFSTCTQALCRAQSCNQKGQPVPCPRIKQGSCKQGCVCIPETLKDENGNCIPEDQCPGEICGVNEQFTECPSVCNTDACPNNLNNENDEACIDVCGPPKCECRPYYRRDDNGECIPIENCRCGVNEQITECTNVCNNDSCPKNLNNNNEVACIKICGPPKCECMPYYKRDDYGDCIPIQDCPEICPFNEVYSSCTQASCRPQNCTQIGQPIACPGADIIDDDSCQQGCVCDQGTLRDDDGNCIPEEQCPRQELCGINEQYTECSSICNTDACPKTLNNDDDLACSAVCGSPKCECIPRYKRNDYGDCIPIEDCPEICPFNEVYSSCTQASCRPQNCTQIGQPIACPGADIIDDDSCQQGCVCDQGTLRDDDGNCIPEEQCPRQKLCGINEQYTECSNICNTDACPKTLNNDDDLACSAVCGSPKCECIPRYKRNDYGDCIPIEDCPEICPFNEVYSSCTQASCRPQNCTQIGQPIACPGADIIDDDSCQQGCVCDQGTLRDDDGNCIPEEQCPRQELCGINEQYTECSSICNTDACPKTLNNDDDLACSAVCGSPKCECIPRYKRNDYGDCIPIEDCPEICPFNEVYSSCTQASCRPQNCTQIGQPIACPGADIIDDDSCQQGCVCDQGTLRDDDGNCIPEEQCPRQELCGINEQYTECSSICNTDACPKTLNNDDDLACSAVCGSPKCECIPRYKRNDYGDCIPIEDCPEICPFNEVYSSCTQASCRPQNCTQIGQPIACPGADIIDDDSCQQGCVCDQGTLRDDDGNCIPEEQCPRQELCGINEQYTECSNICNTDACPKTLNNDDDLACSAVCGSPKCECIPRYKRNDYGDCIPIEDCPEICPFNEVYSSCPQASCRPQNCTQIGQPIACPGADIIDDDSCQQGCVCDQGTLRDDDGNCIPEEQCPRQELCGINEQYTECSSICNTDACPKTLNNDDDLACSAVCGSPKCECIPRYKRNDYGDCIPIEDCPEICPFNEVYSSCTQASCRPQNCTQIGQPIACPGADIIDDDSCQQGCVCDQGTLRDDDGNCIPEEQCPRQELCGINEQYTECSNICNTDACPKTLNNDDDLACSAVCGSPKCECIPRYKRNDYGDCIPIEDCPEICPFNEVYSSCTQASCRPQNCTQIGQPIACPGADIIDDDSCQQGCVCDQGTLRDDDGNCIPEDQCPRTKCGINEQYTECSSICNTDACPKTLNNDDDLACPAVCGPPRCECKPRFKRDDNGNCIPIEDCPIQQCNAPNEVLSCVPKCPPERTCRNRGIQFNCIPDKHCQQKCVCKKGYFRNAIGECITGDECDQCPGEKEYFSCGPACDNVCKDLAFQNRTSCPIFNIQCNRKCYCEDGYARDDNMKCVPVDKCPKLKCADPNEEYSDCKKTCPPDLCLSLVARFKCLDPELVKCEPGCSCKSGYLRQEKNSTCVPICGCKEMANSPDCYV